MVPQQRRRVVSVAARAFISPRNTSGGNPVNIFLISGGGRSTTCEERSKLARSCAWESIVVEQNNIGETEHSTTAGETTTLPTFHFYMPTGEEVSFCCHAAIGACCVLANEKSIVSVAGDGLKSAVLSPSSTRISFQTVEERLRFYAKVTGNEVVQLSTETQHNESGINSNLYSLENFLTEMGLEIGDVTPNNEGDIIWPTFINTSIARTKTIIPICSLERLHAATPPLDPIKFATMCDMINSTGIYLYSTAIIRDDDNDVKTDNKKEIVFECRQFPKSSGYSEDPATGIAAGALGASLHKRQIMSNKKYEDSNNYVIYQGTAMNRPSKIHVNICGSNTSEELKVLYTGLVAFDTISISDIA